MMLFRIISALFVSSSFLFALSMDVQSGKEKSNAYSTLHIYNQTPFHCKEFINNKEIVTKIECSFTKAPVKTFHTVKNQFFSIESYETQNLYVIQITPFFKLKLIPLDKELSITSTIKDKVQKNYTHYMIVGYFEKLPLIKSTPVPSNGINFPIVFSNTDLPYVGALGLGGVPLELNQVEDVSDYLDIKKLFDKEQYSQVLSRIERAEQQAPNSIFQSEFLLYKIRTFAMQDDPSEVVDFSKDFLRLYSSDEAVPEVLLMMAKASSKLGLLVDAEYFFDRLLEEHYDSPFATEGLIALGANDLARSERDKALKHLREALEKAENKQLASKAAMRLVELFLAKGKPVDAAFYMKKIADANIEYLLNDYDATLETANLFADLTAYGEAADVMVPLLNTMEPTENRYEELLRQIGLWYDEAKRKEEAYKYYKLYDDTFPYGTYLAEVQERMDKVLFDIGDSNVTKQLELFDTIEQRYAGQEIAQNAKLNKAKLLLSLQRYVDVLEMKRALYALDQETFKDARTIVKQAAQALTYMSLDQKRCSDALLLRREYDFNVTTNYVASLYSCAMQENDFKYASKLAYPMLHEANLESRMLWMYRYVKAKAKEGDDKEVYVLGQDLLTLADVEDVSKYNDVLPDLCWASIHLNKRDKMVEFLTKREKLQGLVFKDIELYNAATRYAKQQNDYTMMQNYAKKVVRLQNKNDNYSFSPSVDLLYIKALKRNNKAKEALQVAQNLVKHLTDKQDLARAFYELGSLAQQQDDKTLAKESFNSSIKADKTSSWAKLSKDALELF